MTLPHVNDRTNQLRLTGQTEPLHWPRYRRSEDQEFDQRVSAVGACLVAGLAIVLIDGFRLVLLHPLAPVLADGLRWMYRANTGRFRKPAFAFLYAPVSVIWLFAIALPALASWKSMQTWMFCLIVFGGWRILQLTKCIREHYLDYALENSQLSVATRQKWKQARRTGFRVSESECRPARSLNERQRKRFVRALRQLRRFQMSLWMAAACLLLTAGACAGISGVPNGDWNSGVEPYKFIALMSLTFFLPGILDMMVTCFSLGPRHPEKLVRRAVAIWCNSPNERAEELSAPWSARGRFGRSEDRTAYLWWNFLFIVCLLVPVAVYYPVYADDSLSLYSRGAIDEYPIAGSKWFAHLQIALTSVRTPIGETAWVVLGTFVYVPLLLIVVWGWLIGPTVLAAETLFEGDAALERDVHSVRVVHRRRERK